MTKQNGTGKWTLIIAILALVVGIAGLFVGPIKSGIKNASGSMKIEDYIPAILYNDGYYSERSITLSGANGDITTGDDLTVTDDATINGGTLTVTTSNTATSTVSVGCVQTYATSTATSIALTFSTIATTTTQANGQTNNGYVLWKYGTCPF